MKKSILMFMFVLIPIFCFAQNENAWDIALAREGMTGEEFENGVAYYYKNPDFKKALSILKVYVSQESMLSDEAHSGSVLHFFVTVAYHDAEFFNAVKNLTQEYTGIARDFLEALVYEVENFASPLPISSRNLDFLWAEFMATGEELPVKKIISALDYKMPSEGHKATEEDLTKIMVFGSAQWSLKSNAEQHQRVYDILEEEADSSKGMIKENLLNILKELSGK